MKLTYIVPAELTLFLLLFKYTGTGYNDSTCVQKSMQQQERQDLQNFVKLMNLMISSKLRGFRTIFYNVLNPLTHKSD